MVKIGKVAKMPVVYENEISPAPAAKANDIDERKPDEILSPGGMDDK
jgi:hypothetical protein